MTSSTVVLDASAFIRAARGHEEAAAWIARIAGGETRALAPELIFAEVANSLLVHVRGGALDLTSAAATIDVLRRLPIRTAPLRELAVPALRLADARGLSAYDACYVVLAEQAEAALVTADRRVAEAAKDSILLD